jgi:hypothetical protein
MFRQKKRNKITKKRDDNQENVLLDKNNKMSVLLVDDCSC